MFERFKSPERWVQAGQEAAIAFVVAFGLSLATFLNGLSKVPDLNQGRAAASAAIVAGLVAVGKGLMFFFTGTVVNSAHETKRGRESGIGLIEALVACFFALLILILVFKLVD